MALPQGLFTLGGAGITSPGGAYTYDAGAVLPQYFAGSFFIDTGYDDPVTWTTGVEAAEVYGGRVYGATGTAIPAGSAGDYAGRWQLKVTPVWSSKFWFLPHSNTINQKRIYLMCDVYLMEPVSTADGAYQRLETVNWSLYRL